MYQKRVPKTMKIEACRGLGGLGSDLGMKILLEAALANFGQPRFLQNLRQISPDGAKLGPRWRQDGPRRALDGRPEVTWRAILAILTGLGSDLCKNGRSVKSNNTTTFWLHFGILAGLFGGSSGLSWTILATSWALLGDLGSSWELFGNMFELRWL